ncbi:MAG: DNA repair protein RecN [Flavobacteriales bacterium]|nr:DNA repair protein RecN [Flavobacteriales bacterium]MDG1440663.1 DNA repair protein RecN [Flavobacteriales bacterium]
MLQKLSISNYALISSSHIDFKTDFTVITGETGAGKSIIFGAIELLLGSRTSNKVLKDSNKKCVVEGVFSQNEQVLKQLVSMDLEVNEDLIIRREIRKNGSSRSFINDSPVKIEQLKIMSQYIIEINGQHLVHKMGSLTFKYDFIDSFINQEPILSDYKNAYHKYKQSLNKQTLLKKRVSILNEKKDFLKFQMDELSNYDIENWDEQTIEDEFKIASNQEEINSILSKINDVYYNNNGILKLLEDLKNHGSDFLAHVSSFTSLNDRINSVKIELEDIFQELNSQFKLTSPNQDKLQELDELLRKINYLLKKFNAVDLNSLLVKKKLINKELSEFEDLDKDLNAANKDVKNNEFKCHELGEKLFSIRLKQIPQIEEEINSILSKLSMDHADFKINLLHNNDITFNGTDDIDLLIAVNNTNNFYPLHKFSSGGELSRVALAMKYITSSYNSIPTLIFDEIDSGISGKVASEVGKLLKEISTNTQVINITHLPQVAAIANHHLNVNKTNISGEMVSDINYLIKKDRIQVLAKMLGGDKTGKAALNNALELLN